MAANALKQTPHTLVAAVLLKMSQPMTAPEEREEGISNEDRMNKQQKEVQ